MQEGENMEYVLLNNGVSMPMLGFGTFQIPNGAPCREAVAAALAAGYRHIDTASSYQNEEAVGQAIRQSGVARSELFITSKAYIHEMGYDKTKAAFDRQLRLLGLEYLDLYLVHMPFGDYYGSWRAMEELYKEGKIRAIGVSNFSSSRLMDLCYNADIAPAVNQIERHPFYQRAEELAVMEELNVQAEAWAPFAEGMNGMFTQPVLQEIAAAHGKSVAQVILRWEIQSGLPCIAKSVRPERIRENFAIWDFELTADEMKGIAALDLGRPQMLDTERPSEVKRVYDFLNNPVVTSLHE